MTASRTTTPAGRPARRLLALLATVATLCTVFIAGSAPAQAATIDTGAWYQLVSRDSGKALAVRDGSSADEAGIVQYSRSGASSQQWQFVSSGGGWYRLRARHSGKVVDVSGRSTANGAAVIQWPDKNQTNQQFQARDTSGGYVQLINRNSGKPLDILNRSSAEGATVSQWTNTGGPNQQWQLVRAGSGGGTTPPPPPPGGGARNPILPGYNADPAIRYFEGQYWIFPTTDGFANWSGTRFSAWSSPDLVRWTNRGVILDLANIRWCHSNAWAPTMVNRNGTYYFYFTACQQIGVARSSRLTGPFVDAIGAPLVRTRQYGESSLDPDVFIDSDGQAYLYFGSGQAEAVRLNSNMTSLASRPQRITPPGYREAPNMFKRNGTYYLMYSEDDTRSENYRVSYVTSRSPLGPFSAGSPRPVLAKNPGAGILGTGHSSVVQVPGRDEWYIAYHRFRIPGGDGMHREVCIDRMTFASNGSINRINPSR